MSSVPNIPDNQPSQPTSMGQRKRRLPVGPRSILVLCLLLTVATIALVVYQSYQEARHEIREFDLRRVSASVPTQLDAYCTEGYYLIPGEKQCSRAPKCGVTPYDDYGWVSENVPMPDLTECTDVDRGPVIGSTSGTSAFDGYVPLCCYEMARTHDPQKCVSDWERRWCNPEQCAQINNDSGCEEGGCQCAEDILTACDKIGCDLRPPVPLSERLHITPPDSIQPESSQKDSQLPIQEVFTPTPDQSTQETTSQQEALQSVETATPPAPTPTSPTDPAVTTRPTDDPAKPTPTAPQATATPSSGGARSTPTNPPPEPRDTIGPTKPQPTDGPHCDASCGVCGWRDAQGKCHNEQPAGGATQLCCYRTCIDHSCVPVHGYGKSSCTSDTQCVSQTAYSPTSTNSPAQQSPGSPDTNAPTLPTAGKAPWLILAVPVIVILAAIIL